MTTATAFPITAAQASYLTDLLTQRGLSTYHVLGLTKKGASAEIDRVKRLPRTAQAPAAQPAAQPAYVSPLAGLPLSKYIVDGAMGQRVHVEVVERRTGRRYMNLLIGSPGAWRKGTLSNAQVRAYAHAISTATYTDPVNGRVLSGPQAAAVRFSREHKCCAVCMSPLSDQKQPGYHVGVGPVCYKRFA